MNNKKDEPFTLADLLILLGKFGIVFITIPLYALYSCTEGIVLDGSTISHSFWSYIMIICPVFLIIIGEIIKTLRKNKK